MKRALSKPVVVFVFAKNRGAKSTRFGGFITRLQKAGHLANCEPRAIALEDLVFAIDDDMQAQVTDTQGAPVVDDASLVYFKSWESDPEAAAALAHYARAKGIPVMDEAVLQAGTHKLSQLFKLWANGVRVTPTYFSASADFALTPALQSDAFVVKAVHGQKGKDNFLTTGQEVAELLRRAGKPMLVQPLIPNNGDYRVLVYGAKVRGALFRQAPEGSHLNNTSAGATSRFMSAREVPAEVAALAVSAAKATKHNVAGVDIIVHVQTGHPYVLEVNQGSQVVTGHFTTEKMAAFDDFVHEALQSRYAGKENRLELIGRHTRVNFPTLGLEGVLAKVDTGAYRSALNATDIAVQKVGGKQILHFTVTYQTAAGQKVVTKLHTDTFDVVEVKNTSGVPEQRFRIKIPVQVHGRPILTSVTLADRMTMKMPVLIGRSLLRGRFLVNAELSRKAYEAQL